MPRCLVSFGANLGDARSTVSLASEMLQESLPKGDEFRISRLFQTPSVGGPAGQPPFVNAVAALETHLDPWEVWHLIRSVEQKLGRQRIRRWEARKIDLDILLYEDVRIWTAQLKIPHPRMCMRRFILLPAMDVAADWLDPVSKWTIKQLASQVSTGKGTILVVTGSDIRAEEILSEVSQVSHARWLPTSHFQKAHAVPDDQRAVGWMETGDCFAMKSTEPKPDDELVTSGPAKLLFFLRSVVASDPWEDQHRELASELRLCQRPGDRAVPQVKQQSELGQKLSTDQTTDLPSGSNARFAWNGPRYLLATNDRAWAIHEIVSALDAMDCPVEPLES